MFIFRSVLGYQRQHRLLPIRGGSGLALALALAPARGGGRRCSGRGGRPEGRARRAGTGREWRGAGLPAAASPASQGASCVAAPETSRSCRARPPPPSPLLRHTDRQGSDLPRPACSQSVMFGQERGGAAGRSAGRGTPAARRDEAVKTHGY